MGEIFYTQDALRDAVRHFS